MIEVLFQVRKDKYKDNPAVPEGLDLVEEEEQITHRVTLDDELQVQESLSRSLTYWNSSNFFLLTFSQKTCSRPTLTLSKTKNVIMQSSVRFWVTLTMSLVPNRAVNTPNLKMMKMRMLPQRRLEFRI